jgi:hypothetical protein
MRKRLQPELQPVGETPSAPQISARAFSALGWVDLGKGPSALLTEAELFDYYRVDKMRFGGKGSVKDRRS